MPGIKRGHGDDFFPKSCRYGARQVLKPSQRRDKLSGIVGSTAEAGKRLRISRLVVGAGLAPLHTGEGLMSHWKTSRLAIFAAACLLGETTGSPHAQIATEWSDGTVIELGGLQTPRRVPMSLASTMQGRRWDGVPLAQPLTPSGGTAAGSKTWEAFQALSLAKPLASITPGRRWERALLAAPRPPPSGAAATSSTGRQNESGQ